MTENSDQKNTDPKAKVERIERTAGNTKYKPRVEEEQVPTQASKLPEEPEIQALPLPKTTANAPAGHYSGGQFSLKRLVIRNRFTKKNRNLSIPMHKSELDYIDRASEEIVELSEVKYWSEQQRNAELKAFSTAIDPLAGNNSAHATRPPLDIGDSLVNAD